MEEEKLMLKIEERKDHFKKLKKRLDKLYGDVGARYEEDQKKRKRDLINFQNNNKKLSKNSKFDSSIMKQLDPELRVMLGEEDFCIKDKDDSLYNQKDEESEDLDENIENIKIRTIFYCSRTHSQLSQFVDELRKTKFASEVKVVSLGSRKTMCINEKVKKLVNQSRINEACLEMNKEKKSKCVHHQRDLELSLRDQIMLKVQNIEEIVKNGVSLSACPYYSTRKSLCYAQLVTLPYQMLFHKDTRESLGLNLKRNLVIIDEAHNLIEALNQMYSVEISSLQISISYQQLNIYYEKYAEKLSHKNTVFIKEILSILNTLLNFLKPPSNEEEKLESKIMSINDFTFQLRFDHFNLFNIEQFIQTSNITNKLKGNKIFFFYILIIKKKKVILILSRKKIIRTMTTKLKSTNTTLLLEFLQVFFDV